jgi:anti-anti-sigma factor
MLAGGRLGVVVECDGFQSVIRLEGELDRSNVSALTYALDGALDIDMDPVIDLGAVTFIDLSGVRAILMALDQLGTERRVTVRNPSAAQLSLLDSTGLSPRLRIDLPALPAPGGAARDGS